MSSELISIEINGIPLLVRKGQLLIEIADLKLSSGINIPRFCYHKKLSISANCRMCLVEVEKSPKLLPACATPVMDGMKVFTNSSKVINAQQSIMELLLINHPLDCPICDQGGECELQDLAIKYSNYNANFSENKRVVTPKYISPLITTEMTRCIHCTRCVRFLEEIAGSRELGMTGRGEYSEINTYISHSIYSELSGNIIDLCPVGALTASVSKYKGRAWEFSAHASIAPHDSTGSNIFIHTLNNKVIRVVPRENENINEVWISDRDRFSYEGMYSHDRLETPLVDNQPSDWQYALETVAKRLIEFVSKYGTDSVGFLCSPTATLEELYLFQKIARGLGTNNIDHRLRQSDFSDQEEAPYYPWLGQQISDLEKIKSALVIGSNLRMEHPIVCIRLRKAAIDGAKIMLINTSYFNPNLPNLMEITTDPQNMLAILANIAFLVAEIKNEPIPIQIKNLISKKTNYYIEHIKIIAQNLLNKKPATILLGNIAVAHPDFAQIRTLANYISKICQIKLGYLPESANSVGAWLVGAIPHRLPGGKSTSKVGLHTQLILNHCKALVLLGIEPEFDCLDSNIAVQALDNAELVISFSAYASAFTKEYSNIILPIAIFAENSGTYINAEGIWQSFKNVVPIFGRAKPAWKLLRMLGNIFKLPDFDYLDIKEILTEIRNSYSEIKNNNINNIDFSKKKNLYNSIKINEKTGELLRITEIPIYSVDPLVRRSKSLQSSILAIDGIIRIHPKVANKMGLIDRQLVKVIQNKEVCLTLILDENIPYGCALIPSGTNTSIGLGPAFGTIRIQ